VIRKVTGRVAVMAWKKRRQGLKEAVGAAGEREFSRAVRTGSRRRWRAQGRLLENEHGSRTEEIQQADHNCRRRGHGAERQINLDRTRDLFARESVQESLATRARRYDSSPQRMNSHGAVLSGWRSLDRPRKRSERCPRRACCRRKADGVRQVSTGCHVIRGRQRHRFWRARGEG